MTDSRYVTQPLLLAALAAALSVSLVSCEKKGSISGKGTGAANEPEEPSQPETVPELSSDADTEVAPVKEVSKIANSKAVTAGAIAAPFQLKAKSTPSDAEGPKTRTVRVKVQGEMKAPQNYYLIVTRQSDDIDDLVQYVLPSESLAFEKINADTFIVVIKTQELNAIFVLGDKNKAELPSSIPIAEPVPPIVVAGSLVAYAASTSEIKVTWTSGGGSTAKFLVTKAEGYTPPASCKDGKEVAFDPAKNQVETVFSDLKAGTIYSFSVCAVNAGAITAFSAVSSTAAKTMSVGTGSGTGSQLPAPVVTSISASSYTIGSTLNLQVTGSHFVSGAQIKIGSAACTTTFTSATQLTCTAADLTAGTHGVTVINPDSQFHTLASALVVSAPARVLSISSVEPTSAYTTGGGLLKVNGGGFAVGTTVSIGGTACGDVIIASPSVLFCTIPAKTAQTYDVNLNDASAGTANLAAAFTYQALPAGGGSTLQVSAVNPSTISSAGGTDIFISGDAFAAGATVTVGGTACTAVNLVNTTTLFCKAPAKAAGSYNVVVTLPSTESATLSNGLTYTSTPSSPVVASVSPATGSAGQTITISGQHFDSDAGVTVGGLACNNTVRINSSTLSCSAPSLAAGTFNIVVTNPQSTLSDTLANAFTVVSAPAITSVTPDVSMLAGGSTITITGSGFVTGATASVGGTACTTPTVTNATTMTCVLPAKAAGIHHLTVTNADSGTTTALNAIRYFSSPSVTSIVPASGELAGGNPLTITGSGFLAGATVTVGGNACTSVTFLSSTSLYCIVPAGSAGAATVVVTNPGTQTGSLTNGYTYNAPVVPPRTLAVSSVEPASVSVSGGSLLKISGTDFEAGMTVTVGGDNCTDVVLASSSMLFCNAPAKTAATYTISITDSESTTVNLTNSLTYVANSAPAAGLELASVTPTSVSTSSQSTIYLTGTGFVSGATVTVGGSACASVVFVNDTTVHCTAPTKPAGTYDIVITLPDTEADTLTSALTYSTTPVTPTLDSVLPASGAAGQTLTISGQNFDSDATVTVGGQVCGAPVWINSSTVTCTVPALAVGQHNVVLTNPQSSLTGTLTNGFSLVSVPEISSVEPNASMLGGAITTTITGTGFAAGATVTVGGAACTSVNVVNATTITCLLPSRSAGFHSISVTNSNGGKGTLPNAVRYFATPAIASVVPASGNVTGGNPVTITGSGFVSGITVTIGASACTPVTFVNASLIYCLAPSGSAGAVTVAVENPTGETASSANAYTYTGTSNAPSISGISPLQGGTGGGGTLTVTGSDFASDAVVTIGGTNCGDIDVVSSSAITCTIPAKVGGTYDVTVTNTGTGLSGSLSSSFTYVSAPTLSAVTPPYMALAGGTTITITGTGFVAGSTVKVGVASCSSVSLVNSNMLTCTAPANSAGIYNVSVVRPDGIAGYLNNSMTYRSAPTVSSVTPNTGSINGGSLVTIAGTNFFGTPTVQFGSKVCGNVSVQSGTSLTCVTPTGAAGSVTVDVISMDGQSGSAGSAYTYETPEFDSGQSTLTVSAPKAPHDNQAEVSVTVVPRDASGVRLGAGKTIEISATGTVTLTGAGECAVVSSGCKRATDHGNGAYTIIAKSGTSGTVTFSAVMTQPSAQSISATAQTVFNTALFTQISSNTTLTTASHTGADLFITGGTMTVDNAAVGLSLGHVFMKGGTLTHNTSTTSAVYKIDMIAASFHLYGNAVVNLDNKGYPFNYSWGASGPSTALQAAGVGSHGGLGSSTAGQTYGDFRNPEFPGANGGGGVFRLTSAGSCTIGGTARITASGQMSSGAGGSVYLNCARFGGTTTSNPAIAAQGGYSFNGGGGRIAMVTTGDRSAFTGVFSHPYDTTSLTTFKTKVKANGQNGGGAGTIYLASSESQGGTLIVDNNNSVPNLTSGPTRLISFTGTVLSTPAANKITVSQITHGDALSTGATDLYKGIKVRPNLAQDNGTPNNILDDQTLTITSNDNLGFTFSGNHAGVAAGVTFRSVEVLDYLHVAGGAIFESNGDVYARYGDLATPGTAVLTMQDSVLKFNSGALIYPGFTNVIDYTFTAISSAVFSTLSNVRNISITGGSVTVATVPTIASLTQTGGQITFQGANVEITSLNMSGTSTLTAQGNLHAPTITLAGTANLNVSGALTTSSDLVIPASAAITATSVTTPGDINITSTRNPTLTTEEISAVNLNASSGSLTHPTSTTTIEKKLVVNLTGQFLLSGNASVNLDSKGHLVGYSWGANGPSTALLLGGVGSHGGRGSSSAGPTYGNFRNPTNAGSNGGGGVLRVTTPSLCTLNGTSRIQANGGVSSGAGGSVYLNCSGITGNTTASPAITAQGGYSFSGGGGRIALISSGNESTFSGVFAYPTNGATLTAFKAKVKANGSNGAGAGTIYLQTSESIDGDLIIDNNNVAPSTTYGGTKLLSFTGTVFSTPTSSRLNVNQITFGTALSTAATDLYKGLKLRPDLSQNNGTPADMFDDQILTIASNDVSGITFTSTHTGIDPGDTFRTIEVIDHLHVGGGAILESDGDVYARHGDIVSPETAVLTLEDSSIKINSGAYSYPNYTGTNDYIFTNLTSATFADLPNVRHVNMSAGSVTLSSIPTLASLTMTGGSMTIQGASNTITSLSVSGNSTLTFPGSLNAPTLTLSGNATLNVTGAFTTNADLNIPGTTTLQALSVSTPSDVNITSTRNPALTTEEVSAVNFTASAGSVTHPQSTALVEKKLLINLSGQFLLSGNATINLDSKGHLLNYSWGPNGPATALQLAGVGSHGGRGSSASGPTYGNFRNPINAGSHGGGGVLRVTTPSLCTLNGTSKIQANGGATAGAGGSVYLNCAGITGNTTASPAIMAQGGYSFSGGGGRIALISSGDETSFSGVFAYPTNTASLTAFKAKVKANGANGSGAGTIYLQTSESIDGDLIIDNNNVAPVSTSGTTKILSFTGTVLATPAANRFTVNQITSGDALSAASTDLYKGIKIRPDLSQDNGTPGNMLDDQILTISSNDVTGFTFSTNHSGIGAGDTFRTIEIVDHLHVGGGAIFESDGDVYARHGDIANPESAILTLEDALIKINSGVYTYPSYTTVNNYVFTNLSGATVPNLYHVKDVSVSGGSVTVPASLNLTSLNVTGGSVTLQATSNTIASLSLSNSATLTVQGSLAAASLTLAGSSSVSVTNALTTTSDLNIAASAQVTATSVTTTGDVYISSTRNPALITEEVNAVNFNISSGSVSHPMSTATAEKRLFINLTGQFIMSGNATVALDNRGYPTGYSWGASGPATGLQLASIGSHGGKGSNTAGPTYGDFRNPSNPGANGGGGVLRVSTPSLCTLNGTSKIQANGGASSGAGGSVYLNCGGITGNTTALPAIAAQGGYSFSGGGGRIALITSGDESTISGVFAYPTDSASMTAFKTKVKANGGGTGGAGTIYLKSSESIDGDLIVDNGGATVNASTGTTDFISTTANSSMLQPNAGSLTAQIAASGTPLNNRIDLYKGAQLNLYENTTPQPADPLGGSVYQTMTLTGNGVNSFTASTNFPVVGVSSYYRFFYKLDHLHIAGNAQVNMDGADLILDECDWQDLGTAFSVPTGSKLTGNALASNRCADAGLSTKGSTVVFTGYFLQ